MLRKLSDPKVTLVYPPNQTLKDYMCKPNGSLAYPNLGGALLGMGVDVEVFDACVGNSEDDLSKVFYQSRELPSGLYRTGVSDERILQEVVDSDVVGLTSIFTAQETMVLNTARLIKATYPHILIIAGGVNARNRLPQFLGSGVDIVFLSEAELGIQQLVRKLQIGDADLADMSGIAFKHEDQIIVSRTRADDVVTDLDRSRLPAWHLLPNERYWKIARPHGGHFDPGAELHYASMMTSMGCVFSCSYCHIANEQDGEVSGGIGRFRIKSDARVLSELESLKRLGVRQVFIEDDTLFGYRRRAIDLLRKIKGQGFEILDVNGVNLVHLFYRNSRGAYVPDEEVLEILVEAGFKELTLAFESGSQRVIKKYASNKWTIERFDIGALLQAMKRHRLTVAGNYMLGYPDETLEEMQKTVALARRHRSHGLDSANFFCVMPLPGTPIFDWALAGGNISSNFDPDMMNWTIASMKNTPVPAEHIEELRARAWREVNDQDWVKYKLSMNVSV
jgi:anaerobic magnesium-protoporphyrin IX monomethyl ester cyclase